MLRDMPWQARICPGLRSPPAPSSSTQSSENTRPAGVAGNEHLRHTPTRTQCVGGRPREEGATRAQQGISWCHDCTNGYTRQPAVLVPWPSHLDRGTRCQLARIRQDVEDHLLDFRGNHIPHGDCGIDDIRQLIEAQALCHRGVITGWLDNVHNGLHTREAPEDQEVVHGAALPGLNYWREVERRQYSSKRWVTPSLLATGATATPYRSGLLHRTTVMACKAPTGWRIL